jgi:hypothetical protein
VEALSTVPAGYRWALTLALVVVIVGLSITPGVARPDDNLFSWLYAGTPPPAQKVFHIVIYAMLAFLWMWTLDFIESTRVRVAITLLLTLGLGLALEWYQTQVPGRFGTLIDVLLNAAGVIVGVLVAIVVL